MGDAQAHGVASIETEDRSVILCAQFRTADVADTHKVAVSAGFQNNIFKLRRFYQAPDSADADLHSLSSRRRRLTKLPGGDLHILFLQGRQNIRGSKAASSHAHRVKPQAHGVFSFPKNNDIGDTRHALDGVANVAVHIIAEKKAVVFTVLGIEAGAKDETAGGFGDGDAGGLDFVGHPAQRGVHAVLHVDSGEVDVPVDVERYNYIARPVVAAGRVHVLHSFYAIDLLLDGRGDRGLYGLRIGAVKKTGYDDLRRRQRGELRNGQAGNGDSSSEDDQQRADRGKDWAPDKKIYKHIALRFADSRGR